MTKSKARAAGYLHALCLACVQLLVASACQIAPGVDEGESGESGEGGESGENGEATPPCPSSVLETVDPDIDKWGCAIATSDANELGVRVGGNVRIARFETDEEALYTVVELLDDGPGTVRMHPDGWERLGAEAPFCGGLTSITAPVPLDDESAEEIGEFVEDLQIPCPESSALVLVPHGGDIEVGTDPIGEAIVAHWPGCAPTSWICRGWGNESAGAFTRWHVSSEDISAESFPAYAEISTQFYKRVVSVHGHAGMSGSCGLSEDVVVGGAADELLLAQLRVAIATHFELLDLDYSVRLSDAGDACTGVAESNIVNARSSCEGGVQLELSKSLRTNLVARDHLAEIVAQTMASWPGC